MCSQQEGQRGMHWARGPATPCDWHDIQPTVLQGEYESEGCRSPVVCSPFVLSCPMLTYTFLDVIQDGLYHEGLKDLDAPIQARRQDQLLRLFHRGFVRNPGFTRREGPKEGDVDAQAAEGSTAGYRLFVVTVYTLLTYSSSSVSCILC